MPRSIPATQAIGTAGLSPAFTAPDALGDVVEVGTLVLVKNGAGAPITLTLKSTATVEGLALPDRALVVAAGATGVLPVHAGVARRPADPDAGKAYLDYSAVASVTRAVVSV